MSETAIEWADAVWNPVTGCTPAGEGCRNCYARRRSVRMAATPTVRHRERYDGFRVHCWPERLAEPLGWKKPRRVFVCSMGDLFHEDVPFDFVDSVMGVIALTPHLTHIALTKRPDRMREYFCKQYRNTIIDARMVEMHPDRMGERPTNEYWYRTAPVLKLPLPNLWLGVSVWDQASADAMIPPLLDTPAAVRCVSLEPMLGPVDLEAVRQTVSPGYFGSCLHWDHQPKCAKDAGIHYPTLDWVICGGETGPGARPMHPNWVRGVRDQCQPARVPFFFKSWGDWLHVYDCRRKGAEVLLDGKAHAWPDSTESYRIGKKAAGRLLDGQEHNEFPRVGM